MKANEGTLERWLRVGIGAGAVATGYFYKGLPNYASYSLMGVGFVLIVTGAVAYCPAWAMLGISTKKRTDGGEAVKT